ncbi:MAG: ABC transporter permease [Clostridiaceae bacterium]
MYNKLLELIDHKELLKNLTAKELKLKYKNSALGFFWSFLNPLMMTMVYTFAFKYIMQIKIENFAMFVLAGLLPWTFFQSSVIIGTSSIVGNAHLVKKVYFPREIIPLSMIFSNFVNYLNTLAILLVLLIIFGVKLGLPLLYLPLVLILFLIFTIGIVFLLSSLNVRYRDITHFVEILFMAWIYLTPVVYSMDQIPDQFEPFLYLNPMTLVVNCVRDTLFYNRIPNMYQMLGLLAYSIFFLVIGWKTFDRLQKSFAEEI